MQYARAWGPRNHTHVGPPPPTPNALSIARYTVGPTRLSPPTTHTYTPHCTYTFTGTISSPSTVLRSGGRWESNHGIEALGWVKPPNHRRTWVGQEVRTRLGYIGQFVEDVDQLLHFILHVVAARLAELTESGGEEVV